MMMNFFCFNSWHPNLSHYIISKEKQKMKKRLIDDLSCEIAYLLDNPTTSSIYMVEEEVIANIQDLVTKLENEINEAV